MNSLNLEMTLRLEKSKLDNFLTSILKLKENKPLNMPLKRKKMVMNAKILFLLIDFVYSPTVKSMP